MNINYNRTNIDSTTEIDITPFEIVDEMCKIIREL